MIKFIECDICRVKPGSPTLCESCFNNRAQISAYEKLSRIVREHLEMLPKCVVWRSSTEPCDQLVTHEKMSEGYGNCEPVINHYCDEHTEDDAQEIEGIETARELQALVGIIK